MQSAATWTKMLSKSPIYPKCSPDVMSVCVCGGGGKLMVFSTSDVITSKYPPHPPTNLAVSGMG